MNWVIKPIERKPNVFYVKFTTSYVTIVVAALGHNAKNGYLGSKERTW